MKRLLLVAFTLAASVSVAQAQVVCPPNEEFCPGEEPGATIDYNEGISVFTPFFPNDPIVGILPPSPIFPNDPIRPASPILTRPGLILDQ